jgi:hypothetical protein
MANNMLPGEKLKQYNTRHCGTQNFKVQHYGEIAISPLLLCHYPECRHPKLRGAFIVWSAGC